MKALYLITDSHDLAAQRTILLRQLSRQEKTLDADMKRINHRWSRWKALGSSLSTVASLFIPKINVFTLGFSIGKRLLRRKK